MQSSSSLVNEVVVSLSTKCRLVFAVAVAVLLAACGSDQAASPAESTQVDLSKVTLRVGYSTNSGKGPQAVREQSGAFEGTPYKIEWVAFTLGDLGLQSVNSGATDLQLQLQLTNAVIAQGNAKVPWTADDAPFSVIGAAQYLTKNGIEIVVHDGSGINSVADLKGKKVAFSKGSSSNYYWLLSEQAAGLSPGDVEVAQLSVSDSRAAFAAGDVDALVAFDYNLATLIRAGGAKVLASSGDSLPMYQLLAARRGLLDDPATRAAVADFYRRLAVRDVRYASHIDAVRAIYETLDKTDPLDSAVVAEGARQQQVPLDDALVKAVQDEADVFFAAGVIDTKVDVRILFDKTLAADVPASP
ncbi:unannotated protein [freshwater metagenome]|uniref:Unannotated protein n=1 Tax=freshwater metagenome TaxID=449393 RepID=A0A6J7FVV9_9ZZZZ